MHSAKRYLLIALSFAICMTVFAAFVPRIAHAVTATLVQVVNTAANPVPVTLTDNPANFPFAGTLCLGASSFCGTKTSSLTVPQTTSTGANVKRLVIDEVQVFCELPTATTVVLPAIGVELPADAAPNTPSLLDFEFPLTVLSLTSEGFSTGVSQAAVRIFANPGSSIFVGINGNTSGVGCTWNLMGHLEAQ